MRGDRSRETFGGESHFDPERKSLEAEGVCIARTPGPTEAGPDAPSFSAPGSADMQLVDLILQQWDRIFRMLQVWDEII
jgi:hypothetical protein